MKKILAIDDKMDNLITISALLKNLMPGCAVITAQSGREGITKAKAELPDAILLDIIMPDMDGFETCRRLMDDENTKHIPVIMITAIKTDSESRIKGLEIGANAFLSKPIDEVELVSQVKVALRIKKAEDALRMERNSLERTVEKRTAEIRKEINERKLAEEALQMNRAILQAAMDQSSAGIAIADAPEGTLRYVNDAGLLIRGGDRQALVNGIGISQYVASWQILDLDGSPLKTDEVPLARAILFGETCSREFIVRRTSNDDRIVLGNAAPIRDKVGNVVAGIVVFTDITDRKATENKLKDTLKSLRNAVSTTIQVMVSAVEARDPYTSGHQIRVANIARAIATEMGLSHDQIDGIRMAGSIHDIGKLSIPAEILSKPGKLSDIEFSLIKEHAQKGYEMLKDVESPWPLAQIVYQHHERMDGSGYPRSLKGDEILLEAHILAVADVVEAMSSHRPYRPGLGIDAALEELEKNRGTHYDADVADACLRLFREKGFQIEGT